MRLAVIDNHDSFTWNLVQLLESLGARCEVRPSDGIDVAGVRALAAEAIVLSPGPCAPAQAGISLALIEAMAGELPMLGVCLGHQAIAQAFGGRVVRASRPMHGKTSPIEHDGRTVFAGLPRPFLAARYHSLVVERASLPPCFEVSAWTADGDIMGLRHTRLALEGVQFHPESFMTALGAEVVRNWLARVDEDRVNRALRR